MKNRFCAILIVDHEDDTDLDDLESDINSQPDVLSARFVDSLDEDQSLFAVVFTCEGDASFALEHVLDGVSGVTGWEKHPDAPITAVANTDDVEEALDHAIAAHEEHEATSGGVEGEAEDEEEVG